MYFLQLEPPLKFPDPSKIVSTARDQESIQYMNPREAFHIQTITAMQAFLYLKEDQLDI